jgi:long-chain fatty acid transport protein
MGGAFIGLADDYSAVFWNPAGLTQLEDSSLTVGGEFVFPKMTYKFDLANIDATSKSKVYPLPFLGYFKALSPKIVAGFAVYAPSGIGAAWNGADLVNLVGASYTWESMIGCFTASPTIAVQLSPAFSVGLSLNLNYGMLEVNQGIPGLGQYTEKINGLGFGATLGALFKPNKMLSIGLTLRTPSKIKLSGTLDVAALAAFGLAGSSDVDREVTWPLWGGVGIALKPMEPLTITFDAQYGDWGKMDKIGLTATDATWNVPLPPFGGASIANLFELDLAWESTWHYRLGMQYMVKKCLALRAGYYYDPAPGPDTRLNIVLPSPDSHWLTFGIGVIKPKFNIDLLADYNLGGIDRDADPVAAALGDAMPGTHGASIFTFAVAFTWKF